MTMTSAIAKAARSDKTTDSVAIQAELDRLDRAFKTRCQDARPIPACIAKAYRTLIAKRRKQLHALQR